MPATGSTTISPSISPRPRSASHTVGARSTTWPCSRLLWAGFAPGALALKPQLGFLVPLALLAAREYRAFLGSVIALGVLGVASVLALGADGLNSYFDRLSFAAGVPVNRELTIAYF